jgi:hypothetical protein
MKARIINIIQGTIQDFRFMDDRYIEPILSDPTKPSLLAKTRGAINNFFGASSQSNCNKLRYLTGTQSDD